MKAKYIIVIVLGIGVLGVIVYVVSQKGSSPPAQLYEHIKSFAPRHFGF